MNCCLIPFLPAVMVAVEHLEELERRLKEERAPFASEASIHLTEMAAAVSELEADRRAAHEHLETESIENSKLRDWIHSMREHMSEEIMADVGAVREANKEEMEQLCTDLKASSQLREDTVNKLQDLLNKNKTLYTEREQEKAQREVIVATLNDQIILKTSLAKQLEQTWALIEELKSSTAAAKEEIITLEESMTLERGASSEQKDNLSREMDQIEEKIKEQMEAEKTSRRQLDKVKKKKDESLSHLCDLKSCIVELESKTQRLKASWCDCQQQVEEETRKNQELLQQTEALKESLGSGKHCSPAVGKRQDQISTIEGKIEEGWTSKLLFQDTLPQICEKFKHQHDEENKLRAEHSCVAQQLEQRLAGQQELPLQMELHMASMVKHRNEIRVMEEKIKELLEADLIKRQVFKSNKEELCRKMDAEKENLSHAKEEMKHVAQLLEAAQKNQEEHEVKMRSDISNMRTRYEKVLQEQAVLQQQMPTCSDVDMLKSHMAQTEKEYKRKESILQKKMQKCITKTKNINQSTKEKQEEVKEKEEMFKEVEDKCDEAQSRTERLKALSSEESTRLTELQLSSQAMKEQTSQLQQPKEDMKAELKELRQRYIDLLNKQSLELRTVEVSIYEDGVNLEQVSMENSRLQLSIRQMTDDIQAIRQHTDQDEQEIHLLSHKIKVLFERLQEVFGVVR